MKTTLFDFRLSLFTADGSPSPFVAPSEYPQDPLTGQVPILLLATSMYERGGAKERKLTLECSVKAYQNRGRRMPLYIPQGTTRATVEAVEGATGKAEGYSATYNIVNLLETKGAAPCLLTVPPPFAPPAPGAAVSDKMEQIRAVQHLWAHLEGQEYGATVVPDPWRMQHGYIYLWDELPEFPGDKSEHIGQLLAAAMRWHAMQNGKLPGEEDKGHVVLGSHLQPGVACRVMETGEAVVYTAKPKAKPVKRGKGRR